jgi:polyisoprenoid-binding protein YceI
VSRLTWLAALILLLPAAAEAQAIDYARSSIRFTTRQMNVPFEGEFRRFGAEIRWNPARPEESQAAFEVDIGSVDLGAADFSDEARGRAFFNVAVFPKASFRSTSVRPLGGDRFEAAGRLAIKGVSRDVVVPFSVRTEAESRVFESTFTLKRLDFRVGEGAWADTGTLSNDVEVRMRLVATRGS